MRKQTALSVIMVFVIFISMYFFVPQAFAESNELQQLIDETPEGGTLELEGITYNGNIEITKPITIIGQDDTHIKGDGTASVIEVKAESVTLDHLHVSNSGMDQSSEEEYTGIRVMANNTMIQNVTITDVFHGIYLTRADHTGIDNTTIIGHVTESLSEQGNGIHIVRSANNNITNNNIENTRDGIYVEYANGNEIINNTVQDARYGLHYMYSDYNNFYDNHFIGNVGGAAIMHSDHIIIENNSFSYNQGSRAFGLLVQTSNHVEMRNNDFHLNHRGLYLEMSSNNRIESNSFFKNQIGIELWTSSTAHTFIKNSFRQNQMDVMTVGGESFNNWFEAGVGNYWDTPMLDLDDDGIADAPYESTSAIASLVEKNELTYLFLHSPAINMYETLNRVTSNQRVMADDHYPLISAKNTNSNTIYVWIGLVLLIGVFTTMYYLRKRRNA